MSLIARLETELKDAMRARDDERRDALRLLLSSLRGAEKELQRPLHDDEELQVLQRERKRRIEAAEAFRAGGRPEQADAEEAELRVLAEFMPSTRKSWRRSSTARSPKWVRRACGTSDG